MHYLTTNPKVKPTQLEYHLKNVAQELVRKNKSMIMIGSYLGEVLDEWKREKQKYAHTKTRVFMPVQQYQPPKLECTNDAGEVVFTIK